MTTKTLKFREGDQLITTTTTVESAVIDFQDILDACEIKDDYDADAPWKNCDGFEHTAVSVNRLDGEKRDAAEFMQGYCYCEADREYKLIQLEPGDDWGIFEYMRERGASRQVAAEAVAASRRKTLEQLVEWYRNGWNYYGVTCEFEGAEASVWGVDDYDYADTDVRNEIASEVAHELEREGYTINYPPATQEKKLSARRMTDAVSSERGVHRDIYPRRMTADQWRAEWKRNMESQNFAG